MEQQQQPQQARVRNPPFRLQLVLPSSGGPQHPRPLVAHIASQPVVWPAYAQLLQLRRSASARPGSSDSGIADCQTVATEEDDSNNLAATSETSGTSGMSSPVVCRICLTSLACVGQSAAANCGHVACLPCLLKWYRSQSVCFCCRTVTTGFTLLYL